MAQVVSAHLVEGLLGEEDVVDQVDDDEAVADGLDDVADGGLRLAGTFPGEQVGLHVHDHLLQVEAVETDDVCVA